MRNQPHILITNDDGIDAEGIKQLYLSLKSIARISIVAPQRDQSATSLSLTIQHPLKVEEVNWGDKTPAWSVNGTPADSVKLALSVLVSTPPDLIISGINRGSNAGRNILYSGTVACAIEAALRGIPSIAFSTYNMLTPKYEEAVQHIPSIVEHVLTHPLPDGTLLNVNFPGTELQADYQKIQGFKMTHQGKEYFLENPDIRQHPVQKSPYYWLGLRRGECVEQEDCDIKWLQKGYVTAVPLHVSELTDRSHLLAKRDNFENSLNSKLGQVHANSIQTH